MGSRKRLTRSGASIALLAVAALCLATRPTEAHKAITSRYDYNRDVYPLLRDHCGQCHVTGGPAPMSLLTYKDAVAWAESVRDELTAERMPPWPLAAGSPAVKGARPISARDLDVIVTWASGGAPLGNPDIVLPDTHFTPAWRLGAPDLQITMDAPHTVAAGTLDEVCDFTLSTGLTETTWVRAVDIMPGTPTLARDASISVENGPLLALWQPDGDRVAAPPGAAFRVPAGARLHLQMHYKKHFDVEQTAVSDRSTIGLYFTDAPASGREMQSLTIDGPAPASVPAARVSFTGTLAKPARILALRPALDRAYASLTVDAVSDAGVRTPLLDLHAPRPQWVRRYWLQEPVDVAGGTRIEVSATPLPSTIDEPAAPRRFPLQLGLDFLPE